MYVCTVLTHIRTSVYSMLCDTSASVRRERTKGVNFRRSLCGMNDMMAILHFFFGESVVQYFARQVDNCVAVEFWLMEFGREKVRPLYLYFTAVHVRRRLPTVVSL